MGDHQEKIVALASELLRERNLCAVPRIPSAKQTAKEKSFALKAACMAALISASGAFLGTSFYHEMSRPINRYERVEIEALLFYTSRETRINQKEIKKQMQKALDLPSLQDLSAMDHRRIRDYLWTRLDG